MLVRPAMPAPPCTALRRRRPASLARSPIVALIVSAGLAHCGSSTTNDGGAVDARSDVQSLEGAADASSDSPNRDDVALVDADIADTMALDAATSDSAADVVPTTDAGDDASITDRTRCTLMPDATGTVRRMAMGRSGTMPYLSYVPTSYAMARGHSLVIALHGAGDTAANYLAAVWRANADALGFIVVAPDGSCALGSGNTWCRDDANSIIAVINDVEACYSVDRRRRILNGFSAGGVMTYLIGMQIAREFAGLSVASANLGSAEAAAGRRLIPAGWTLPITHVHGTTDMNFPIATVRSDWARLEAAGHRVFRHEFDGGHTTNAAYARTMYMDLASSMAP